MWLCGLFEKTTTIVVSAVCERDPFEKTLVGDLWLVALEWQTHLNPGVDAMTHLVFENLSDAPGSNLPHPHPLDVGMEGSVFTEGSVSNQSSPLDDWKKYTHTHFVLYLHVYDFVCVCNGGWWGGE